VRSIGTSPSSRPRSLPWRSRIAGAVEHGCTTAQAVSAFRSIWYSTVGEILVRAHTARRPPDAGPSDPDGFLAGTDPTRLPHLTAIGTQWPKLAARDTYRQASGPWAGLMDSAGRYRREGCRQGTGLKHRHIGALRGRSGER
jgi:hypothetical protein